MYDDLGCLSFLLVIYGVSCLVYILSVLAAKRLRSWREDGAYGLGSVGDKVGALGWPGERQGVSILTKGFSESFALLARAISYCQAAGSAHRAS
jgi:hypothetical protein